MKSLVICLLALAAGAGCARAPALRPTAVLRLSPGPTATPTRFVAFVATAAIYPTATPHVFCDGAMESFLIVGERGRVTLTEDGKSLNLRAGPSTDFDVIGRLAPLDGFLVLAGAQCAGPYTWFQVDVGGQVGWIAEGADGQYFAEPWLPG